MGIVRMGAPEEEIIFLKQLFHLTRFVETGTFKGGTSIWASQFFKQVDTIEFSKPIYLETSQNLNIYPISILLTRIPELHCQRLYAQLAIQFYFGLMLIGALWAPMEKMTNALLLKN